MNDSMGDMLCRQSNHLNDLIMAIVTQIYDRKVIYNLQVFYHVFCVFGNLKILTNVLVDGIAIPIIDTIEVW